MTCLGQRLRQGKKSPVREPMMFMFMNTTKSTSRRQGREGDRPSEGSRSANVRADGQKPHTRLSPWASWHNTTKPAGSGGRVNAAVVHGKFTPARCSALARKHVLIRGDLFTMRQSPHESVPKGFTRITKSPVSPLAVGGESVNSILGGFTVRHMSTEISVF